MAMTVPADSGSALDASRIQSQCYLPLPGGWARALIDPTARDVERDAEGQPRNAHADSLPLPLPRPHPAAFLSFR